MPVDLAIVEADGNGGDLQLSGNDLAVVFDIENMPFLAMFGGNPKQSTTTKKTEQSFDYWANSLFYTSEKSVQFNSITELTINTTELTSQGRSIIESAVKTDIQFIKDMGYTVDVNVEIPATDRINVSLKITRPQGGGMITIIQFKKQAVDGDFFIMDFNNDFFV